MMKRLLTGMVDGESKYLPVWKKLCQWTGSPEDEEAGFITVLRGMLL
jgi:hypothetical protein